MPASLAIEKQTLKFAVISRGETLSAWEMACLDRIIEIDDVELLLLIKDKSSSMHGRVSNISRMFWNIYDYYMVGRRSGALKQAEAPDFLARVPSIYCNFNKEGISSCLNGKDDIVAIEKYELDFILSLRPENICGDILNTARYGVWSYRHGNEGEHGSIPSCFWEIYKGEKTTAAMLVGMVGKAEKVMVLKKGLFKTNRISYVGNLDNILFEISAWPAMVCMELKGPASSFKGLPGQIYASVERTPGNLEMICFFVKVMKNLVCKVFMFLFYCELWNVGVVDKPINSFLESNNDFLVEWLSSKGRSTFNADPFGIVRNGNIHILYEIYKYDNSKGYIYALKLNGGTTQTQRVFDSNFHMSYPYLLEYENEVYCIPEMHESNEISIYKAEEFPCKWRKAGVLVENFAGVDGTVFFYNKSWWLTAAEYDAGDCYKLHIWHAKDLFGQWEPHAANPVKVDITSARPAGTPFVHNGRLYRPSQDCSEYYGKQVIINQVLKLTPTKFEEEEVAVVKPFKNSPYPDGLHTISAVGNKTVIDGKKHVFIGSSLSMLVHEMSEILSKVKNR